MTRCPTSRDCFTEKITRRQSKSSEESSSPVDAKGPAVKKDVLINLYWILDAVQKGSEPNPRHVAECFISIRDELMLPDTEEMVVHLRGVLEQSQATADALSQQLIGDTRRQPLPEHRLRHLMALLAGGTPDEVAVDFGRLVEAAHGIKP